MTFSRDPDDDPAPPADDPAAFLDRLDAEPDDLLPDDGVSPPFDREEIDALVHLVLDEELARLDEKGSAD